MVQPATPAVPGPGSRANPAAIRRDPHTRSDGSRPLSAWLIAAALAAATAALAGQTGTADSLILITLDGARHQEMFGGLDADVLRSTLAKDAKLENHQTYQRFTAATPEERREKLLPFFWREL